MSTEHPSVYYFQYKLISDQRGLLGRLGEAEIASLLPHAISMATPQVYPPGTIVWCSTALDSNALEFCQWLSFVTQIDELTWASETPAPSAEQCERLRRDYDAFLVFLSSAERTPIRYFDKGWVEGVKPQAFDYQSPARQSPYLIRAMVNLGYNGQPVSAVLDPMGGYGQTLFECVLRSINGATLEISPTASQRSADNFRSLLERLRLPFSESRVGNSRLFEVERCGRTCRYQIINGDTRQAHQFFDGGAFDSVSTDFPYGVRTGSRTDKLAPTEYDTLLDAALPAWRKLLKPHGTLVIAYNRHTLRRETVLGLAERHGLRPRFPEHTLSHRVSEKILRDIVVFERNA